MSTIMNSVPKTTASAKDEGFTLLEMLLNLAIAVMLISLFPLIITNISIFKASAQDNYDINVELCLRDLIAETKDMRLVVVNKELLAKEDTYRTYNYSFDGLRIIRKAENSGYVILMERVKSARFYEQNGSFYLEMTYQDKWRVIHEVFQIR
ncbi:hypothetical protein ERX27_06380 [Macrococcus brunensis]|uniref:Prepilin-type N-terminal cleavage/methylation domain-containing protein n=2 Tax=Macrococcus brunensis TaxID=198483 RepID=A0A4R6BDQ7_9STAP|nr:hypothetical protein ERX27_06380 [Macrococcus brunensis]